MPRTTVPARASRLFPSPGRNGRGPSYALRQRPRPPRTSPDWCDDAGSSDHCEIREFTVEDRNGALEVNASPNGGIRVEGWSGNEIRVQARVTTRARTDGDAAELAREVEILSAPGRLSTEGPRTGGALHGR
jgi:hypothetical protein